MAAARGLRSPRPAQVLWEGKGDSPDGPFKGQRGSDGKYSRVLCRSSREPSDSPPPCPRLRTMAGPRGGLCAGNLHTYLPADVVKREQPACVPRHPDLNTPKKRFPEELSLRVPHIAIKGSTSFPVPPAKDPQLKGSEIHSRAARSQSNHGCVSSGCYVCMYGLVILHPKRIRLCMHLNYRMFLSS